MDEALEKWQQQQQQQQDSSTITTTTGTNRNPPPPNSSSPVKFVDASWYHKGPPNQGRTAFEQGPRIPGAVYFDPLEISTTKVLMNDKKDDDDDDDDGDNKHDHDDSDDDPPKTVGFMLPTPEMLGRAMDALEIGPDTHVILYGQTPRATFVPRVWFTLDHWFQHPGRVSLLNGTLQDWTGPLDTEPTTVPSVTETTTTTTNDNQPSNYLSLRLPTNHVDDDDDDHVTSLLLRPNVVAATPDQVLRDDKTGQDTILLDARGSSFVKGHMPGAKHVPYSSLMATATTKDHVDDDDSSSDGSSNSGGGYFQDTAALQALFQEAGVDPLTPQTIVCTCGSGVSACSLYLALMECGRGQQEGTSAGDTLLYDGSWAEWKQLDNVPKVFPVQTTS